MTGMRARGTTPRSAWRMRMARRRRWSLRRVVAWVAAPYVRSAALLMDMTGAAPGVRRWLPVRVRAGRDARPDGADAARRHSRAAVSRRRRRADPPLVIFPGVHGGGVDEPRLVALSRRIAATGATVLSVPLPDLRRYHVTPRATDMIEDVVAVDGARIAIWRRAAGSAWSASVSPADSRWSPRAGRALAGKLTGVFALGAHADLPRVIRYLCLAEGAPKTLAPPHDYGVVADAAIVRAARRAGRSGGGARRGHRDVSGRVERGVDGRGARRRGCSPTRARRS